MRTVSCLAAAATDITASSITAIHFEIRSGTVFIRCTTYVNDTSSGMILAIPVIS